MKIPIITRQQLEVINRIRLKYSLHIAEKDYFLAIVLQIIYSSELTDKLVFKGGTALHHCYLDQLRFSEDLDFTSIEKELALIDIGSAFADYDFLSIKKDYVSDMTLKIEKLQYQGPLGLPNFIKIDIDKFQNVYLPVKRIKYQNVWNLDLEVCVMDIREICAEKFRTASDRARYRDFYDLYMIMQVYKLDVEEVIDIMKNKEIRNEISKDSITKNWEIASEEKSSEILKIYYKTPVKNEDLSNFIGTINIPNLLPNVEAVPVKKKIA